jgi:VanZ family protein
MKPAGVTPDPTRLTVMMLGLLLLIALTLLVNHPSVRFERVVQGLVSLDGEHAPAKLPAVGGLKWEHRAEGILLRIENKPGGQLRWEQPRPDGLDKLRLVGRISVSGEAPEARPWQRAQLFVVQPDENRQKRLFVARWTETVTDEVFDRLVAIPDPSRPLWIELSLTPLSGQVVLHRLTVDGLATRPGIDESRLLLLTLWVGLILAILWHLARPMAPRVRDGLWVVLAFLFVGILSPPELLREIKDLLAILKPPGPSTGPELDVHVLGHFGLFGALGALLFWGRADLDSLKLLVLLVALAGVTELMQVLVDGRHADWRDVGVDLAGAFVGALSVEGLRRLGRSRVAMDPSSVKPTMPASKSRRAVVESASAPLLRQKQPE